MVVLVLVLVLVLVFALVLLLGGGSENVAGGRERCSYSSWC